MDLNSFTTFKTLGEINTAISQAASLDAALKAGLKIIRDNLAAEMAVIWFYDKEGDKKLHPSYWVAPNDITDRVHAVGEGAVGRSYQDQKAVRSLWFETDPDVATQADFDKF